MNPIVRALVPDLRQAGGDASLLLLVGGLAMLSLIVFLVILQNMFPEKPGPMRGRRHLRPVGAAPHEAGTPGEAHPPTPRSQGAMWRGRPGRAPGPQRDARGNDVAGNPVGRLDDALDRVVSLKLGEPRVLRRRDRAARLRLYACRGCTGLPPSAGTAAAGSQQAQEGAALTHDACRSEAQGIESVLREAFGTGVAVRETACRRRGDPACDFEVQH